MNIETDSYFVIGATHLAQSKPCQDHALSKEVGHAGLIAVADGCSQKDHTDIGARILTCAAIVAMSTYLSDPYMEPTDPRLPAELRESIRISAQGTRHMMGLRNEHLYATCLYGLVTEAGGFVHLLGDGHAIFRYDDGSVESVSLDWEYNMPYYLAYNGRDTEVFTKKQIGKENGIKSLVVTKRFFDSKGSTRTEVVAIPVQESLSGYIIPITLEMIQKGLRAVLLASDGLSSFQTGEDILSPEEPIRKISALKNYQGEFAKRRINRMLEEYEKSQTFSMDDLSCAALSITHSEKQES